jgi:hypothetical protein
MSPGHTRETFGLARRAIPKDRYMLKEESMHRGLWMTLALGLAWLAVVLLSA